MRAPSSKLIKYINSNEENRKKIVKIFSKNYSDKIKFTIEGKNYITKTSNLLDYQDKINSVINTVEQNKKKYDDVLKDISKINKQFESYEQKFNIEEK